MSGRLTIAFVDFAAFSSGFNHVRGVSFALFLVRNWCVWRSWPSFCGTGGRWFEPTQLYQL